MCLPVKVDAAEVPPHVVISLAPFASIPACVPAFLGCALFSGCSLTAPEVTPSHSGTLRFFVAISLN